MSYGFTLPATHKRCQSLHVEGRLLLQCPCPCRVRPSVGARDRVRCLRRAAAKRRQHPRCYIGRQCAKTDVPRPTTTCRALRDGSLLVPIAMRMDGSKAAVCATCDLVPAGLAHVHDLLARAAHMAAPAFTTQPAQQSEETGLNRPYHAASVPIMYGGAPRLVCGLAAIAPPPSMQPAAGLRTPCPTPMHITITLCASLLLPHATRTCALPPRGLFSQCCVEAGRPGSRPLQLSAAAAAAAAAAGCVLKMLGMGGL